MRPTILIIDTFSHFHRAYHALPDLRNLAQEPTGAVYGVINMLINLRKIYPAVGGVCVFDAPGKTFRHELYPAYKANRDKPDDDFIKQIEPLLACITASEWHCIQMAGVEADDVIGSLAECFTAQGYHCLISTGDKDLAQLVNDNISLINTMSGEFLDTPGVHRKFGVWPQQMIDYLTLVGDTSDNVPGVSKVGPKTAQKWLAQYGCLDNLWRQKDAIPGVVGKNLRESTEQLQLSKKLVTILRHLDFDKKIEAQDFLFRPRRVDVLRSLYKSLNFTSLLKKLPQETTVAPPQKTDDQETSTEACFFFVVTPHRERAKELTKTLSYQQQGRVVTRPAIADDDLKNILRQQKHLIGHQVKTEFHHLNIAFPENSIIDDVALVAYLLQSHKKNSFEELTADQDETQTPAEKLKNIWDALSARLEENKALSDMYQSIEQPLQRCLLEMEQKGVLIDVHHLKQQGDDLAQRLEKLTAEIYNQAGEEFNIQSTLQLTNILFHKMGLPVLKKTPKGAPSTDEEVLYQLADYYEIADQLIQFRLLSKIKSTYVDGLLAKVQPQTQRIHTTYAQTTTITGRLSSVEPNLQNIPIRTEEGRMIRRAFIAPANHVLLSADYSQIELRLMAHLSGDPTLQRAFHDHQDIHCATAAEVLNKKITAVTPEERRRAKAVNFGLIYGMSSFGLAKQLGLSRQDAQFFIDRYFERYPGVADFMSQVKDFAHKNGYVETILGRRLWLPEINIKNKPKQIAAERTAINAPLQGSAADLIKVAMVQLSKKLLEKEKRSRIIMQVHDELVLEVPEEELAEVKEITQTTMTTAVTLTIPLIVSLNSGPDWATAH